MYKSNLLSSLHKNIFEIFFCFLLLFYFYKLYLEFLTPVSGDELNSILVYSSNIKTLFLKHEAHNAVFFHLIGYLKSIVFGFEINTFRGITFFFILIHFFIIKKLKFDEVRLSLFFILLLISNFSLYGGIYVGYIFSSSIFVSIFYLVWKNERERNNKFIYILLFIQLYNHMVNIYLVLPILITLFIYSKKKKFFYESIIFFAIPTSILYSFSIILTGLSKLKISDLSYSGVLNIVFNDLSNIISKGFEGIFLYDGISNAKVFSLIESLKNLYTYDKVIFIILLISIFTIIVNFLRKKYLFLSTIILIHFLLFIILNKQPPPRIFISFFCFYILFTFTLIDNVRYPKYIQYIKFISISLIFFIMLNFNFSKIVQENQSYKNDINFTQNKISIQILKKNCELVNYDFSEMQKKNLYFNYLNYCNKKFNLNEFLIYYRS